MKFRLLLILNCLLIVAAMPEYVAAEERYREFVQGLRDRQYFDSAMLYLEQLEKRDDLPDEIRQVLVYEKAITLRENAKVVRTADRQFEQLDQALGYLEQFSREHPDHRLSADANLDRAQILIQKAEVEVSQAKLPANKSSKTELQRRARELIKQAESGLKLAFEQHDAALKKMPTFVDEQKEPALRAQRDDLQRNLILETLNLAECTYYRAQTYDPSSREYKQLLEQAVDEFEKIHQTYSKTIGALHARLWQGRCYLELGDRQKALGLFNELLGHPDNGATAQILKTQALVYKLRCLSAQEENQSVVELVDEWMKQHGGEARTALAIGLLWEQARAYEALGDARGQQKPDQEKQWRQARNAAQQVIRYPSENKEAAQALLGRMQTKLGVKDRKPNDFDTAFNLGRQQYNSAQEIRNQIDAANRTGDGKESVARLTMDWTNELTEALRNLELASTLVTRKDAQKDVATAQLLQAYANFYLRRHYDAAVLGRYLALTTTDEEGTVAPDAAYMSLAALVQAYNDNKVDPDQKSEDMRMIIQAADLIFRRWHESEKANEARLIVGRLYTVAKQPVEAASWFKKVPENDPKYPEAQLAAGQAYWVAYGAAAKMPSEDRPPAETLAEWKSTAEQFLRTGITKLSSSLTEKSAMPQELVTAKIYLAEILLSQGKDADAAAMLRGDPQSVIKAISIDDESKRPEKGIQSRPVAKSVYTLLLRADIGMGVDKLNDARATMRSLEAIAAGDARSDLTDLYVGLGRVLKTELERFRTNGETARFKKLMTAFESFLDDMSKKQDGQTLGSLSWIGEAYFALGENSTDYGTTERFYDRAANAFNAILTRAQGDPNFASEDQLFNVKVRVIRCNRLKKDFNGAEKLLTQVLKARGNDLRAQIEGAEVYQAWGLSGDSKKFLVAISGKPEIGLWGWGGIAKRLQQQKNFAERPELVESFLNARYGVSFCRYQYAKDAPPKDKQKALDLCAMELISSCTIMKSMPDENRIQLNGLYHTVLKEAGKPKADLPGCEGVIGKTPKKPNEVASAAGDVKKPEEGKANQKTSQRKDRSSPQVVSNSNSTVWILGGVLLVGTVIVGTVVATGRKSRAKPSRYRPPDVPLEFSGIANTQAPTLPSFLSEEPPQPRPKPISRPAKKSPESTEGTPAIPPRPIGRPAEGTMAQAKPRPKPPNQNPD